MKFIAQEEDKKKRLDHFLAEKLPQFSRSAVQKLIKKGLVSVNEKPTSVHHFLKPNDEIEFIEEAKAEKPPLPKIPVLMETEDYLVINKPAGILTHHAQGTDTENTVADWVVDKYPHTKEFGNPARPGIVHRLDRDTSGVMLIALNKNMYEHLRAQFKNREIHKTYLALVHGNLPHQNGIINKPIGRSKSENRMAARTKATEANDRPAITAYEVIKQYKKFDAVHAYPKTGRTHQIRVHFMSLGHSIVGDKIYAVHGQKKVIDLGRNFLHAEKICFLDLKGSRIMQEAPMPIELENFLKELKPL